MLQATCSDLLDHRTSCWCAMCSHPQDHTTARQTAVNSACNQNISTLSSHRFCNETLTMDDRPTRTLVLGSHLFKMCSTSEAIAHPHGRPGNNRKIIFVASSGPDLCWSAAYKPAMSPAHADTTQCDHTVQLPVHNRPRHLWQLDL